jgi:hypothetical protein
MVQVAILEAKVNELTEHLECAEFLASERQRERDHWSEIAKELPAAQRSIEDYKASLAAATKSVRALQEAQSVLDRFESWVTATDGPEAVAAIAKGNLAAATASSDTFRASSYPQHPRPMRSRYPGLHPDRQPKPPLGSKPSQQQQQPTNAELVLPAAFPTPSNLTAADEAAAQCKEEELLRLQKSDRAKYRHLLGQLQQEADSTADLRKQLKKANSELHRHRRSAARRKLREMDLTERLATIPADLQQLCMSASKPGLLEKQYRGETYDFEGAEPSSPEPSQY